MSELSELSESKRGVVTLSTRVLVPSVQRFGNREIETTFLGNNSDGQPTWMLWNPLEPYLIGVLRQGRMGFTLEQRTDQGVMLHENISLKRLQKAIGG
jgi:hypothetical protein